MERIQLFIINTILTLIYSQPVIIFKSWPWFKTFSSVCSCLAGDWQTLDFYSFMLQLLLMCLLHCTHNAFTYVGCYAVYLSPQKEGKFYPILLHTFNTHRTGKIYLLFPDGLYSYLHHSTTCI